MDSSKFIQELKTKEPVISSLEKMEASGAMTAIADHIATGCEDCANHKKRDRIVAGISSMPDISFQGATMLAFYENPGRFGFKEDKRDEILGLMAKTSHLSSIENIITALIKASRS